MADHVVFELAGREVRLSNPNKVYFPKSGWTKGDLARYHVECADALLNHLRERPVVLKRFPGGIGTKAIYQKRVPKGAPDSVSYTHLTLPTTPYV